MVTQSKVLSAKGSFSAFTCAQRVLPTRPSLMRRSRPCAEHGGVDVREHDEPALAHLLRHAGREIAGAAGHVQRFLTGPQVRELQRELLPQPVHAAGHEVVHQVVVAGDGVEHAAHAPGFFVPRDALVAEVGARVGPRTGALGVGHLSFCPAGSRILVQPGLTTSGRVIRRVYGQVLFKVAFLNHRCAESGRLNSGVLKRNLRPGVLHPAFFICPRASRAPAAGKPPTCSRARCQAHTGISRCRARCRGRRRRRASRRTGRSGRPPDPHVFLPQHQHLLPRPVALHFGGRRMNAQVFEGQLKARAILEADLEHAGLRPQLDLGRSVFGHGGAEYRPSRAGRAAQAPAPLARFSWRTPRQPSERPAPPGCGSPRPAP